MAFGQQSGPPATGRQVRELLDLLINAGHSDFRDARGPMGFTQRQAGGKFTRDEADGFIEQLQSEADAKTDGAGTTGAHPTPPTTTTAAETQHPTRGPTPRPSQRTSAAERALRQAPTEALAAELQRRGWVVMEP